MLVVHLDAALSVVAVGGGLAGLVVDPSRSIEGSSWLERAVPEDARARVGAELAALAADGVERAFAHDLVAPDGRAHQLEWRARRPSCSTGSAAAIVLAGVIARAESVRAPSPELPALQEELRREREIRAAVASSDRLALIVHDRDSVVRSVEGRAFVERGIDTSTIVGASMLTMYASVPGFPEAFAKALAGERTALSSRTERTAFEATYVPLFDARGAIEGVASVVVDVTPNAEAERELKRARDLLRSVIDSTPDWVFAKDREHRFLVVNEAFARSQDLSPEAMIGHLDSEFWPLELCEGDAATGRRGFHDDDRDAFEGRLIRNDHDRATMADGSLRVFDTYKGPLRDARGEVYGVLAYSRDVTEARAAAQALRDALAERETLLREIHHRVKNNLQMVASLVHFHAKGAPSAEAKASFADLSQRLLAMSLVHEKLYRSSDLSRVDLGEYVSALVHGLADSLATPHRVRVELASGGVRAPIEAALPAGMIVCELVTNALKHAYPEAEAGPVTVVVEADGGAVAITVRDEGVGLPPGFEATAPRSFGWTLVRALVDQLRGALSIGEGAGARVAFTFPLVERRRDRASSDALDAPSSREAP